MFVSVLIDKKSETATKLHFSRDTLTESMFTENPAGTEELSALFDPKEFETVTPEFKILLQKSTIQAKVKLPSRRNPNSQD